MELSDGSEFDSRQEIEADAGSETARRALAGSWLWWDTVTSVVLPILEYDAPDAFALVVGQKSTLDFKPDGSLRRSRLRGMLPGGVGSISIARSAWNEPVPADHEKVAKILNWNREVMGSVGIQVDRDDQSRWRFLKGNSTASYLRWAGEALNPTVFVNTESFFGGDARIHPLYLEAIDDYWLISKRVVLVLPHTDRVQQVLDAWIKWAHDGRPELRAPEPADFTPWTPETPPDPHEYTQPIPVSAEFHVTGLIENEVWQDASRLEAARRLLQARFDLKLGIWDLVNNDALRETLLEETHTPPRPPTKVLVPQAVMDRAIQAVDRRMEQRRSTAAAVKRVRNELRPLLDGCGWQLDESGGWTLPLTRPYVFWGEEDLKPLIFLILNIEKRRTRVYASTSLVNDGIDVGEYLRLRGSSHTGDDKGPASPALLSEWPVGWSVMSGWDEVGRALAERTPAWIELLQGLLRPSVRAYREKFAWRPNPDDFKQDILPRLAAWTAPELSELTNLSRSYCAQILKGRQVPALKHWNTIEDAADSRDDHPPTRVSQSR